MLIREITLFKTPMEINGENRYFPDEEVSLMLMKEKYLKFLKNSFDFKVIKLSSVKGVNVADTFTITLPIDFIDGHEFNYACILTDESIVSNNQYMFYFIKSNRENNSMENMQYTFYLDYLIQYSKEIYVHKSRQVLKERSHIPYIEYIAGVNRIKNGTRVLNTYSKPMIADMVEGENSALLYDILWYDVQVTRFQFRAASATSSELAPAKIPFTGAQNFTEGFASTYHLFRPYKIYKKGTREEIKNVTINYYNYSFSEESIEYELQDDTIVNPKEVEFADTTANIVNISLTFNSPIKYTTPRDLVIQTNAIGSPIYDMDGTEISDKHFFFTTIDTAPLEYIEQNFVLDNLYPLSIPLATRTLLSKNQLIDNSPLLRYSNLYCYNLIFNNTIVPLYTEKFTSIMYVNLKLYPKPDGAFVRMTIFDEDNNVIYNANNLPLFFERVGTIPYSIDQYQAYKVANGNRIKANIIGRIAGGAVTLGTMGAGAMIAAGAGAVASPLAETAVSGLLHSPANLVPIGGEEMLSYAYEYGGAIRMGYNGERATRIMNELATYADLKNLVTIAGQSAQNSMSDTVFQDRMLISINKPIDKYCESMFSFCKEYQDYGAIINREDEFLTLFKDLESFMYIKTVDIQLPISSAHNSVINAIFNRGVRLWHCIEQNQPIAEFNTMISNYER